MHTGAREIVLEKKKNKPTNYQKQQLLYNEEMKWYIISIGEHGGTSIHSSLSFFDPGG